MFQGIRLSNLAFDVIARVRRVVPTWCAVSEIIVNILIFAMGRFPGSLDLGQNLLEEPNYTEPQMMAQIAASLSAFPLYRLIDARAVSPLASESQKPSITHNALVFVVLVGVSLLIYFVIRKAITGVSNDSKGAICQHGRIS